jgi:hypothetical protein
MLLVDQNVRRSAHVRTTVLTLRRAALLRSMTKRCIAQSISASWIERHRRCRRDLHFALLLLIHE